MLLDTQNILISDANHGGLILLDEYSKYTNDTIYFYDTYNKLTTSMKDELKEKYMVCFVDLEYVKEHIDEFISICPVHMKPLFRCDFTHHEFTGYLINEHKKCYGWNFPIVEITGVKGKTTTVNITCDLLSDFNVLSLTSEGLIFHKNKDDIILDTSLSITPASIIVALNKALNYDILDEIDFFICEVSLGITTNTDIGVLTNILENYPIAGKTNNAANAKKTVFNAKLVVCDMMTYNQYYKDNMKDDNITQVSLDNINSDIYTTNINYSLKKTEITINNKYQINCFALSDFYVKNILFAIAITQKLGLSWNDIKRNIKNIKSIKGRGSYKSVNDKIIFEDINPGLNTTSISKCIDNIKRYSDNYIIILGGDYGITCEEIDEEKLIKYMKKLTKIPIIMVGELGRSLNTKLNNKYEHFMKLEDAYEYIISNSSYDIIQIIYRSEYNSIINY
ncbi:coenzyme F430 synthase [Methanosphaera cuniculi]|uniref:UDP-N-acetylmuramoyl-L-alanyl-D-glutamate--2, 6-diaminopimelate ligase n=1 Tax=Methanosphaera cuniculi TaxID=1077256 RepID=A0A2A2HCY6_9EURY|nr:coenzyme F430 synthase [Methanosphaera cuniculi]PAV07180.1 hypothetical protein ASJ82_05775 [Methanosphaera cuniculi]PWL07634.1 UDP-N-acetylmuramoyl-L-alanyl-D-glutamate--2,6-diaminopimelate ligase [Methanosphaera cuniculi]